MKTLVIHPKDYTTDFLSKIYDNKGFEVITENVSHSKLKSSIKEHDRIIMLGHGDENGLYGHGRRIITSEHVQLLIEKQCISIWCHADSFMNKYKLKGFYTGMFISELEEAYYEGVYGIDLKEITDSNNKFACLVNKYLDSETILSDIKSNYVDHDSSVILFNTARLNFNV